MPDSWLPAEGHNSTEEFALNKRCNIAATYCSVTGADCFVSSTFESLLQTAFNIQGIACTDDFNGEPFWGLANVLIQWKQYQFEQCWESTISTVSASSTSLRNNHGSKDNINIASTNHLSLVTALLGE